jgi:hypothetical protein
MNCIPGYIATQLSTAGYKHRLTGTGDSYSSRKRQRVTCPQCNKDLSSASLKHHLRTHRPSASADFSRYLSQDYEATPMPCP